MTDQISTTAMDALQNSRIKVDTLSETQKQEVLAAIQNKIQSMQSQQTQAPGIMEAFSINWGCIACQTGLYVLIGVPLAAAIAGGVAVAPEAGVVVAIAEWFGVEAEAVTSIINTIIQQGSDVTVEGIISSLCENFGAC